MEQAAFPKEVDLGDQAIVILWDDGHRSPYPHRYLRLRCPCAGCVDEMSGAPLLDPEQVARDVRALDHMAVGNYGLQFLWSDAHDSGYYGYRFLRSACTCIACNAARAGTEPAGS